MRVLLTGHKGYIGSVLAPMLVEDGFDVVGYDSDLFVNSTFGEGLIEIPEIKKDIRDIEISDLEGFDAVLHLAGLSNDPLGDLNPDLTYEINHLASVRMAALAKEAGVKRFVFSSSCSNYGASGDDFLTEESPFNPVTPYGISKVRVEKDVSKLASSDFSPVFLRNATAFGVSPRLRFDLVLNNLIAWAFTTGKIHLKSDGSSWRPIVHIEDISRAFIAMLKAPLDVVHNQAFNVGRNEDNYRIRDLAEIVAEIEPDCEIEFSENAVVDKRNYRVDCSKIRKMVPEFEPQWDARKGARQILSAYEKFGLTLQEFEGPRYQRIGHIKQLMKSGLITEDLRWEKQIQKTVLG